MRSVSETTLAFNLGGKTTTIGRVKNIRKLGEIIFIRIFDLYSSIQIIAENAKPIVFEKANELHVGDLVWIEGIYCLSKTQERSIMANKIAIISACLCSIKFSPNPPKKRRADQNLTKEMLEDPEYAQFLIRCSRVISALRFALCTRGFLEFDTGILERQFEGGFCRPFETHVNALGRILSLHTTSELKLKQILAGGIDKLFEITRSFRNEGINKTCHPEHIQLECYQSYMDCSCMMALLESLIIEIIEQVIGEHILLIGNQSVDFTRPFKTVTFQEAATETITNKCGMTIDELIKFLVSSNANNTLSDGQIVEHFLQSKILPMYTQPTFLIDLPSILTPLAKAYDHQPLLAERSWLIIDKMVISDIYTDENRPEVLLPMLEKQERTTGIKTNTTFLSALELGIPPSAGFSIGIERFLLSFRGSFVRDIKITMTHPIVSGIAKRY